jgi:hypothetical protein
MRGLSFGVTEVSRLFRYLQPGTVQQANKP